MDREEIKIAMNNFCLRVLSGGGEPQEVAILPAVLTMILRNEKTDSGN